MREFGREIHKQIMKSVCRGTLKGGKRTGQITKEGISGGLHKKGKNQSLGGGADADDNSEETSRHWGEVWLSLLSTMVSFTSGNGGTEGAEVERRGKQGDSIPREEARSGEPRKPQPMKIRLAREEKKGKSPPCP